jgi:nucleotide-binding universal stress UspA family protein
MFKKILVPCDGSDLAGQAVFPYVEDLGKQTGAEVTLLQVIPAPSGRSGAHFRAGAPEMPISLPETPEDVDIAQHPIYKDQEIASAQAGARSSVAKPQHMLRERGVHVRSEVILGEPAEEIVEYAEQENFDLIVMCSHGSSGIRRWVFGSVTEKVLRGTAVPVLVIHPEEWAQKRGHEQSHASAIAGENDANRR